MNSAVNELIVSDINCINWQHSKMKVLDQVIQTTFELINAFETIGPIMFATSVVYRGQKNIVMVLKYYQENHNKQFLERFANYSYNGLLLKVQPAQLRIVLPQIEYPDLRVNIMNQELVTLYSNTRMHPKRLELLEIEESKIEERRRAYQQHHQHQHQQNSLVFPFGAINNLQGSLIGDFFDRQFMTSKQTIISLSNSFSSTNSGSDSGSREADESTDLDEVLDNEISMINERPTVYRPSGYVNNQVNNNMVFFPSINYYYSSVF